MNRKRQKLSIFIWGMAVLIIRGLYLFLGWNSVTDIYGFYENAMIRAEESEPMLSSGLSFVYSNFLSDILRFTGNYIHVIFVIQVLLQVVSIFLFLGGCYYLWGKTAAFIGGTIWALLPTILKSAGNIEPLNFYLLHFMILFFLLAHFYHYSNRAGWHRSSPCELYLILIGVYLGVICTWNYMGWLLVIIIGYILKENHPITRKLISEQKELHKKLPEKEQIMSSFSQGMILFVGVVLGMFVTLMKYTGISGKYLPKQFEWWAAQYQDIMGFCQGMEWKYAALLLALLLLLMIIAKIIKRKKHKNEEKKFMEAEKKPEVKQGSAPEKLPEKEPDSFVTEDGRVIKYLENPLPVPKKHVAKDMDFEFDIDDTGDFDIIDLDAGFDLDTDTDDKSDG